MCRKSRAVCMRTIILDGTTQLSFLGSTRQSRRRFHYFICTFTGMTVKTWNGLYRMSRLGLIAAIPGKGLTNGLLLRRAVECVTVTREDECLTSNKAYSFFSPPPSFSSAEIWLRYAQRPYLCARWSAPREKMNFELYSGELMDSDWRHQIQIVRLIRPRYYWMIDIEWIIVWLQKSLLKMNGRNKYIVMRDNNIYVHWCRFYYWTIRQNMIAITGNRYKWDRK